MQTRSAEHPSRHCSQNMASSRHGDRTTQLPWRSMRSEALKHRNARRMLFAQINQGAAGWMQTTAGSWYVLTEAGSTTTLSFFVIVDVPNGDNLAALWMAVESTGAATVTSTRQVFSAEEIDQIRPNIPGYRAPGE